MPTAAYLEGRKSAISAKLDSRRSRRQKKKNCKPTHKQVGAVCQPIRRISKTKKKAKRGRSLAAIAALGATATIAARMQNPQGSPKHDKKNNAQKIAIGAAAVIVPAGVFASNKSKEKLEELLRQKPQPPSSSVVNSRNTTTERVPIATERRWGRTAREARITEIPSEVTTGIDPDAVRPTTSVPPERFAMSDFEAVATASVGEKEELHEVEFSGINENFKYKNSQGEYFFKETGFPSGIREVISSKLAHAFGLEDNFLPTTIEKLNEEPFVVTPFLSSKKLLEDVTSLEIESPENNVLVPERNSTKATTILERYAGDNKVKELYLFDYITNQQDRHGGNILVSNSKIISIDNGISLYSNSTESLRQIRIEKGYIFIPPHSKAMTRMGAQSNIYQDYIEDKNLQFNLQDISPFLQKWQASIAVIEQTLGDREQTKQEMLEVLNWRMNKLADLVSRSKKSFTLEDLFENEKLDSMYLKEYLDSRKKRATRPHGAYMDSRKPRNTAPHGAYMDSRKPRNTAPHECTPGKSIPCKGRCIPKDYTCRDKVAMSATEQQQIKQIIAKSGGDKYEGRTIRDLQQEARDRGVYRSNHLTKDKLRNVLKQLDKDPASQENLRQTLEKRRKTRELATKAAPKELRETWEAINRVSKAYKQNPDRAGLIIAAGLLGISSAMAQRIRDRHTSGLSESADLAFNRAKNLPIDRVRKNDIIFAVGGMGTTGSRSERIADFLNNPLDNTKGEKWLGQNHHIIGFNSPDLEFEIQQQKRDANGRYNPLYMGEVAVKGMGSFLQNFRRSRNDSAVDLAAQIYAYQNRYPKKKINILAHGIGGNITDEAVEILARMKAPNRRGFRGEKVAAGLNIARLGSSHFGMMRSPFWKRGVNHRTITGSKDPFSIMPKRAAKWIGSLTGHEVEDYLSNRDVREQLKETFGYYSSSLSGKIIADRRRKENRQAVGEAISTISPGAGKLWTQIGRIQDKARENPVAAGALSVAVLTGTSVAAYNRAKKRYNSDLNTAANEATIKAKDVRITSINNRKPRYNTTFVVGGTGTSAEDIIDNLPEEIKAKTHVVKPEGVSSKDVPSNLKPGTREYAAWVALNGYGGQLGRIAKAQFDMGTVDPEAFELAKQLYRYGQNMYGDRSKRGYKDRNAYALNIIASGDGAIKARQAMEILEKMGGNRGKSIAKQMKLATFGSPGFGLSNEDRGTVSRPKYVSNETSFMGEQDFFNLFPARSSAKVIRPKRVGGNIKDYLQSEEVKQNLLDNFYR